MMRWLIRLAVGSAVVALLVYLWSRLNQDTDDEDLDDEIPIEFDVPAGLDAPAPPAASESAPAGHDTGDGPGADTTELLDSAPTDTGDGSGADKTALLDSAPADFAAEPAAPANGSDDLTLIRGIGPVFQKRLNGIGILTFRQLAEVSPAQLEEAGITGVGVDLDSWVEQARAFTESEPA